MTHTMKSRYNGFCVVCKTAIHIGDEIQKDEKSGKWVHVVHNKYDGWKHKKGNGNSLAEAIDIAGRNSLVEDEGEVSSSFSTDWTPSKYQQAIFDFIRDGKGNAVVEAVAGSGKTSTIVKALEIVPKDAHTAFLAFNKHIAKELKKRAPDNVHVSTIHSLGYSLIRKLEEKPEIDEDKVGALMDEFWPIAKDVVPDKATQITHRMMRGSMRRVISLCKATLIDYDDPSAVLEMIERYGIDINEEHVPAVLEKVSYLMNKCMTELATIDFDDMIWLPLVHSRLKNHFDKFDYLFVDEAQDLNNSQTEFILRSVYPHSRIIVVGDRRQSLYGFRGADTDAIPNLIRKLNAITLPLSISYRCPRIHVARAKEIVPQIEPSDTAIEGKFGNITYKEFIGSVEPGDMVMCRTNAPLVKPAFEVIRAGKKAIIRGKDIGAQLVNFIERFQTDDLSQLEIVMAEFTEKEYTRLMDRGKELQAEMVKDKTDTIRIVSNECKTTSELIQKLEMLFSDSNIGVVFSSVHRAKGLESEKTFVLRPELMPHPKAKQDWEQVQEMNCLYVAITRSKNEMYFVETEALL